MRSRRHHVQFWLDDKEAKTLENKLRRCGLTLSAYMRHYINGYTPKDSPPPDYYAMMQELYDMRTSLDRLLHEACSQGFSPEKFDALNDRLDDLILNITKEMIEPVRIEEVVDGNQS